MMALCHISASLQSKHACLDSTNTLQSLILWFHVANTVWSLEQFWSHWFHRFVIALDKCELCWNSPNAWMHPLDEFTRRQFPKLLNARMQSCVCIWPCFPTFWSGPKQQHHRIFDNVVNFVVMIHLLQENFLCECSWSHSQSSKVCWWAQLHVHFWSDFDWIFLNLRTSWQSICLKRCPLRLNLSENTEGCCCQELGFLWKCMVMVEPIGKERGICGKDCQKQACTLGGKWFSQEPKRNVKPLTCVASHWLLRNIEHGSNSATLSHEICANRFGQCMKSVGWVKCAGGAGVDLKWLHPSCHQSWMAKWLVFNNQSGWVFLRWMAKWCQWWCSVDQFLWWHCGDFSCWKGNDEQKSIHHKIETPKQAQHSNFCVVCFHRKVILVWSFFGVTADLFLTEWLMIDLVSHPTKLTTTMVFQLWPTFPLTNKCRKQSLAIFWENNLLHLPMISMTKPSTAFFWLKTWHLSCPRWLWMKNQVSKRKPHGSLIHCVIVLLWSCKQFNQLLQCAIIISIMDGHQQ